MSIYGTIQVGATFTKSIMMETETCANCGIPFAMPSDFRSQLLNDPNKSFYCPNGHSQHYAKSREVKLREEAEAALRKKEQEITSLHNKWIAETQERYKAEREAKTANRKLKRLNNGICSCCNRTFTNLAEHIKNEHPELIGKEKPKRKYKTTK